MKLELLCRRKNISEAAGESVMKKEDSIITVFTGSGMMIYWNGFKKSIPGPIFMG